MRMLFLFVRRTGVVLVLLLFGRQGFAQGCDEGLQHLQVLSTPPRTYITSTYCGGSGNPTDRCLQTEFKCDAPGETGPRITQPTQPTMIAAAAAAVAVKTLPHVIKTAVAESVTHVHVSACPGLRLSS
jgi:hypothetical protein